jgi:uracil-DNA glycosylase family 4
VSWYRDFIERLVACRRCPRLVAYRESVNPPPRFRGETYWARPVPPWGDLGARLMIVGLAPAAHGGNRTGRMFTGDRSAQNLFAVLHSLGLSNKPYSLSRDDGVELRCVYITSAVKCAPPRNRPTAEEVRNCSLWLAEEISAVRPQVIVALGRVAWDAVIRTLGAPPTPFAHGAVLQTGAVKIYASYHPSPLNVGTRRVSLQQIAEVIKKAAAETGCLP